MSTRLIAGTIMSAVLLLFTAFILGAFWQALTGCESPSTEPQETIQYESTHEETTTPERVQYSNEHIQYHSVELPETGGLRI